MTPPSTNSGLDKQTQPVLSGPSPSTPIPTCADVCAKFITTTHDGRTQSIYTCYNVALTKTPQSTFTQCRKTHPHRQKSRYMFVCYPRHRRLWPALQNICRSRKRRRHPHFVPGPFHKWGDNQWSQNSQDMCCRHSRRYNQDPNLADLSMRAEMETFAN